MIAVEKDVAMPKALGAGPTPKYPWCQMEIGDSFLFPADLSEASARAQAHQAKRHHRQFAVRKMTDGIRCWRIA